MKYVPISKIPNHKPKTINLVDKICRIRNGYALKLPIEEKQRIKITLDGIQMRGLCKNMYPFIEGKFVYVVSPKEETQ